MPKSLQELAIASLSANVSTVVDRFIAQNGILTYVAGGKESQYEAHFSVNNQLNGGTITINTHSVAMLQRAA